MGFIHNEVVVSAPRRAAKQRVDTDGQARGCENCSLRAQWPALTTPRMPLSGNLIDGDILILGEAPGEQEDKDGVAFVGPSGNMLRGVIPGRDLDRLIFQNTVRCRPRDNATPGIRDSHACSVFLEEDIERLNIKAIIGVGGVPLARFYPGANITRVHGTRFPVRIGSKVLWYYPVLHPSYVLRTGGAPDRRNFGSAAYPILKSDMKALFQKVDTWRLPTIWEPSPADVLMPQTEAVAREILAEMQGELGVDLETQKLKPFLKGAKLLTAAISDETRTIAFPIEHPEDPNTWGLKLLLEVTSSRPWIAHNAVFELVWLLYKAREAGIDWQPAPFDDSMACGRLYHARETILSLSDLTRIHLGVDIKSVHKVNLSNMEAEPLSSILPYNGLDALSSVLLLKRLKKRVDKSNYDRFIETMHSTARMELYGLDVDSDVTAALKSEWQIKNDATAANARGLYEVRAFERERQSEFNIASSVHVGSALVEFGKIDLPKTKRKNDAGQKVDGEQYSTDDEVLREHAASNPLVNIVLEWRESNKQITTYIDSVARHCAASIDGWLHPSYTTLHTATTRLSSTEPNIQNFPKRRHRELRRQVIPDRVPYFDWLARESGVKSGQHGKHVFLSVDYGQLEARVYACITQDPVLCSSTIAGEDIHSYWRDRALALYPAYIERLKDRTNSQDMKAVMKGGRDIMKSDFVFASFFGSVAKSVADRTGMPLITAQELLGEFWKRYSVANKWLQNQRQQYADTGSIYTLEGIERHGILWGNETINTPIQGTAAHVVLDAQNELSRLAIDLHEPYLHPRINVHDDITLVLPYDMDLIAAYIHELIAPAIVRLRYKWQIVPFMGEFSIAESNWAHFEPIETIVGEYHR